MDKCIYSNKQVFNISINAKKKKIKNINNVYHLE